MAAVEINLQAMPAVAARNALFQHPFWAAGEALGRAIDYGNGEAACEAMADLEHIGTMIARLGWTEAQAAAFSGTASVDPVVLGDALDCEAEVIAARMGENAIDTREGHRQLGILYGIADQLADVAGAHA
jgi:hypothetical protein